MEEQHESSIATWIAIFTVVGVLTALEFTMKYSIYQG